jgi:enterobacteria phage integrase
VTIKHVHRFKDRHGKVRHYLRLPGAKAVALPGMPGEPAFMAAYQRAIDAYVQPGTGKSKATPRSMRDLAERYFETGRFKGKADRTRHVEKLVIERFLAKHADKSAERIETRHLDAIFSAMADRPAAAMDLRKKLKALFTLAIKLGWRRDDPTAATDSYKLGTWHTWEDDEVEAFEKRWPVGTRQRFAFDLLIFTGQRSSDVRRMRWTDARGSKIRVKQAKTGAELMIHRHPDLEPSLEAFRRDVGTMVLTEFGRPFTEKGFGNWMADAIDEAGLPDRCVTHGIRKAAARRLAEAGCTAHEIASITGHKSLKEVQRYTEAVARTTLAESAIGKVAASKGGTSGSQT